MIPDVYPKTHASIIGAFIAGGFAVSPALAGDIDVFIQVTPSVHEGNLPRVRQHVLAYLVDQYGLDMVKPEGDHSGVRNYERNDEYQTIFETMKVARVIFGGLDYHVLLTTGSIEDVLDSFDLSIAQVAIDELGSIHKGHDWTEPWAPIVVVKDTPTTYARMLKYMERFHAQGDAFYTMKHDARQLEEENIAIGK